MADTTSTKPAESKQNLRQKVKVLEKEAVARTIGYIVGAFGLVAVLAWNDLVQQTFSVFFPAEQESLIAKLFYALASTLIALIVILLFSRWAKKS